MDKIKKIFKWLIAGIVAIGAYVMHHPNSVKRGVENGIKNYQQENKFDKKNLIDADKMIKYHETHNNE